MIRYSPTKPPTKPPTTAALTTVAATKAIPTASMYNQCPAAPVCTPMNCMPSCPTYCCKRSESPRPEAKNDVSIDSDNCPALCYNRCAPICPRRCCGPHPGRSHEIGETRPNIHIADLPYGSACPNICKDVCALECPHRCCGPGSFRRSHITYPYSRIPRYGYRSKKSVSHVSTSYLRRFGAPKL